MAGTLKMELDPETARALRAALPDGKGGVARAKAGRAAGQAPVSGLSRPLLSTVLKAAAAAVRAGGQPAREQEPLAVAGADGSDDAVGAADGAAAAGGQVHPAAPPSPPEVAAPRAVPPAGTEPKAAAAGVRAHDGPAPGQRPLAVADAAGCDDAVGAADGATAAGGQVLPVALPSPPGVASPRAVPPAGAEAPLDLSASSRSETPTTNAPAVINNITNYYAAAIQRSSDAPSEWAEGLDWA